jgi:hypothetical protein
MLHAGAATDATKKIPATITTSSTSVKTQLLSPPSIGDNGQTERPHAWRGFGGLVPTIDRIEYDKQLDRISIWMESWNHEQVCTFAFRLSY